MSRSPIERVEDGALGLSCVGWAVAGILEDEGPPLVARIGAASINAAVGLAFLLREGERTTADTSATTTREGAPRHRTREIVRALPSLIVGGLSWRISGHAWPEPHAAAFLIVALAACATVLTLGRSFAIFAAKRTLRTRGPYAVVRHPLYLLELALIGIAGSVHAWWAGAGLVALGATLLVPRIRDEERALAEDPQFSAYATRVKFRLVPGVW